MIKNVNRLTDSETKLKQISQKTFSCLYGGMFGYTINRQLLPLWIIMIVVGGILLAKKYWLIRPVVRIKIAICEIIITSFLSIFIFSNFCDDLGIIKDLMFLAILLAFFMIYFKALYNDKLTKE